MSEYEEKSRFDEGYDSGYEAGTKAQPDKQAIRSRYEYLRLGGEWQTYLKSAADRELYLAGFEDAMRAAGVVP